MASEPIQGFKFTPCGIGNIFKTHKLKIPPYQREYAWEAEQVQQLFNDFNRARDEHSDYFLGTIVTIRGDKGEPLDIVDGQQRLTTTALLIAAIRDVQNDLGQPASVIESINNDYLSTFDRKAGGRVPKLILNIDDNEFFEALIEGREPTPKRESHHRLLNAQHEAKAFVRRIASTFSEHDKPTVLNDWLDFIEQSASVILVETDDGSRAFKMFETLNDRGLRTSQADLVKGYLFGQSGKRISEAQARWSSMKDNLEEIADDDRAINFLRHSFIATSSFVRAEQVYDHVQKTIRGESNSTSFLSNLEGQSRAYVATFQPSAEHWRNYPVRATRALAVFNKFDLKPIRPLVLSLALKFRPMEFEKAIILLVSISVRLVLASRTRSGTIEQTFASAALNVYDSTVSTANQLKTALKNVIVSDLEFKSEFSTARVSKQDFARYYLRALEAAQAADTEPWYIENDDPSTMTLEHILPLNAQAQDWNLFTDEERRLLVKRLGNLCLLNKSANEGVGNKPFLAKKPTYANAPFATTNMVDKYADWSADTIDDRQGKLAELALKAWPI